MSEAAAGAQARGRPAPRRGGAGADTYGAGGAGRAPDAAARDPTLTHPRCVYQILKRHFARYTPELVERAVRHPAGAASPSWPRRSPRTPAASAPPPGSTRVGWTQHTVGAQYIRTASILQLLLGNMGRPGGGILALRGHASIQGSTDIPTLFNLLPGYLPMPHAHRHDGLDDYLEREGGRHGLLGQPARLPGEPAQGVVGRRRHRGRTTSASTTCRASPATTATTPP